MRCRSYIKKIICWSVILFGIIVSICEGFILSELNCKDAFNTEAEYIVVLGSRLDNGRITENLQMRLDKALELESVLEVPIIVSGGITGDNTVSEAIVMREYLLEHNKECQVIVESNSTNTKENFLQTKNLVGNVPIAIITSDFHMFRAKILADSVGFDTVNGATSKILTKDVLYYHLREVAALLREAILFLNG